MFTNQQIDAGTKQPSIIERINAQYPLLPLNGYTAITVATRAASLIAGIFLPMILGVLLCKFSNTETDGHVNTHCHSFADDYFYPLPVWHVYLAYAGLWFSSNALNSLSSWLLLKATHGRKAAMTDKTLSYMYELPISQIENEEPMEIIGLGVDIPYEELDVLYKEGFEASSTILELACLSAIVINTYSVTTGVSLLAGTCLYNAILFGLSWLTNTSRREFDKAKGSFRGRLQEMLQVYRTTRTYNCADTEIEKFRHVRRDFDKKYLTSEGYKTAIKTLDYFLLSGILFLVTMFNGNSVLDPEKDFSPTDFILINTYLLQFLLPLSKMLNSFTGIVNAKVALEQPKQIMKNAHAHKEALERARGPHGSIQIDEGSNGLSLKFESVNLVFLKTGDVNEASKKKEVFVSKPILQNANMSVQAGERVAIVGATGSGKSTINRLFTGLQAAITSIKKDNTVWFSGDVKVGGKKIVNLDTQLLNEIGFVMQETHLIRGTWGENLYYGHPSLSFHPENSNSAIELQEQQRLLEAIEISLLANVIPKKPDGSYDLDAPIASGNLSGGEKQRIGLARVILRKPKLIFLDEATSALDGDSEARFLKQFNHWLNEDTNYHPTVVSVTHRLTGLEVVDKIFVLNGGNLDEQGVSHTLLRKNDSVYLALFRLSTKPLLAQAGNAQDLANIAEGNSPGGRPLTNAFKALSRYALGGLSGAPQTTQSAASQDAQFSIFSPCVLSDRTLDSIETAVNANPDYVFVRNTNSTRESQDTQVSATNTPPSVSRQNLPFAAAARSDTRRSPEQSQHHEPSTDCADTSLNQIPYTAFQ